MGNTLYHYTTIDAFKNILETKKLWASNIFYTTDFGEVFHGQSFNTYLMDKIFNDANLLGEEQKEVKNLWTFEFPTSDIYFLSFSKNKNDLSQWRAYAPKGISFGIKPNIFNVENTYDCLYTDDEKAEYLRQRIDVYNMYKKNPRSIDIDFLFARTSLKTVKEKTNLVNILKDKLLVASVKEKLPIHCKKYGLKNTIYLYIYNQLHNVEFFTRAKELKFHVENEVRYFFLEKESKAKFKVSNNLIIPYLEINCPLNSIDEIWINCPNENFHLMKYSISKLWKTVTSKDTLPSIFPANITER